MAIEIRPLHTPRDYHAVEALQRAVWGLGDTAVVPLNMLVAVHHNGGIVLGAFDTATAAASNEHEHASALLVGFVLAFVGLTPAGSVKLCSHMAGVLPAYQNCGIGARLKRAQRAAALQQGISLITWTFNPLLCRNAHFNLGKLGATSATYLRNIYGDDPFSPQEPGGVALQSDRLLVEWHLDSPRVRARLDSATTPPANDTGSAPLLNPHAPDTPDLSALALPALAAQQRAVRLAIPRDWAALAAHDRRRAAAWQQHLRVLLETLFAHSYRATDVLTDTNTNCCYLLEQEPHEN